MSTVGEISLCWVLTTVFPCEEAAGAQGCQLVLVEGPRLFHHTTKVSPRSLACPLPPFREASPALSCGVPPFLEASIWYLVRTVPGAFGLKRAVCVSAECCLDIPHPLSFHSSQGQRSPPGREDKGEVEGNLRSENLLVLQREAWPTDLQAAWMTRVPSFSLQE